jgi:hypothetical protein
MLGGATAASAQTVSTTGLTTNSGPADTRKIDEARAPIGNTAAFPTNGPVDTHENWRKSDGFNSDPNNPYGAPPTQSGTGPVGNISR